MKRSRGGLVFKAHRLVYHSTLGWRVIKKEEEGWWKRRVFGFDAQSWLGGGVVGDQAGRGVDGSGPATSTGVPRP